MPIVITESLVLSLADTAIPATHPRILYDDVFSAGTLAASTEATGFAKQNAVDFLTYDFWKPTALPATIDVTLDEARAVDYLMVAAHSLGTCEAACKPQYYNGSSWVDLADEVAPGSDRVLAFLFEEVFTNKVRLRVTGDGAVPSIGVVMAGKALALERGVTLKHTPSPFGRKTVFDNNASEAGQWLGRSIRRYGVEFPIGFMNLSADWVREFFTPFIASARTRPFGWLWSPVRYPDDAAYCRCDDDIRPEHDGLPDFMNVEFPVKGLIE